MEQNSEHQSSLSCCTAPSILDQILNNRTQILDINPPCPVVLQSLKMVYIRDGEHRERKAMGGGRRAT
jgi:hypothetical protein